MYCQYEKKKKSKKKELLMNMTFCFQAPPDVVTSEQRHEAEQVFLQLRNTKNPFNLCRQLLGKEN